MKLATQVFVSETKPEPHLITPIVPDYFWKPMGGLWTSTLNDEGGQWVEWLHDQGYTLDMDRWGGKLWLLEPAEANVCVINDVADLRALHERFPKEVSEKLKEIQSFRYLVDWEALSQEYDAVHAPDPRSQRWASLSNPNWEEEHAMAMFFDVMDAESTCWFHWCFEGEPQLLELARLGT